MILLNILFLGLASGAMALPSPGDFEQQLFKRQKPGANPYNQPAIKPVSVKEEPPKFDKAAKRQIIRWGPYKLQPADAKRSGFRLDPHGDSYLEKYDGICHDCMFLAGSTYLTYENGTVADVAQGIYNHHIAFYELGSSMLRMPVRCPPTDWSSWFGGGAAKGTAPKGTSPKGTASGSMGSMHGGHQKRSFLSPKNPLSPLSPIGDDGTPRVYASSDPNMKTGYYIEKDSSFYHYSEFINYKNYTQTVYITLDAEFVPKKPADYRDAYFGAISAGGCSMTVGYFPEEGKKHTLASPAWPVVEDGAIFNMFSHLHDGGINILLKQNGKVVCDSKAIYGSAKGSTSIGGEKWETIQNYEICNQTVHIKKGDNLVLESIYDTSLHRLRPGAGNAMEMGEAMGLMGWIYSPKPGT